MFFSFYLCYIKRMNVEEKEAATTQINEKFVAIEFYLNERGRRVWAATEARSLGRGGVALVSKALGMSNATVVKGLKEIDNLSTIDKTRVRKAGGGRKSIKVQNPQLLKDLDALVEPTSRGDPESPLRWTSKSVRKLSAALQDKGHSVSFRSVSSFLKELGYSLQANRKTKEGGKHPDRDAQFHHINKTIKEAMKEGNPCISVDTKKKENIGEFKNNGQEYSPKGQPAEVNVYDFIDKNLGKVAPYGVYDIGKNEGWVSVGISADTSEFAVNTIRAWWYNLGHKKYESSSEIIITADCGGSNGYRVKLWKLELQKLANELLKTITVRHLPPGTSKWNKIEHKLFSYISKNWRGRPLLSTEVVIQLIGGTTTTTGLTVQALLDKNIYIKGKQITQKMLDSLNIEKDAFHPEWNYSFKPNII